MVVTLTQLLAVYGATLSSVALGWNLYRDLVDRGKLKISAAIQRLVVSEDGKSYGVKHNLPVHGASEKVFVVITAVNVGRRQSKSKGGVASGTNHITEKIRSLLFLRVCPRC